MKSTNLTILILSLVSVLTTACAPDTEIVSASKTNTASGTNGNTASDGGSNGGLTPAESKETLFVKNLYREALGREVETAGLDYFVSIIRQNLSVSTCQVVIRTVYNSPEFKNRNLARADFVEVMYRGILGRASDTDGKAFWLNYLNQNPDYATNVEFFLASNEAVAHCRSALGAP